MMSRSRGMGVVPAHRGCVNASRLTLLLLGGACSAFGLTVTITSVNQTQAILSEQGFAGDCTIQISTSFSMNPIHPDVDGAEYPGSDTDTGRADTIVSDGTRTVTLGHQTDDRALAAYTVYYYQVSGCGGTVTGTFTTANLSNGTTRTEQSPFNASRWGNLGLPAFDWTQIRSYVDPLTGVTLIPMATTTQTWRSGCGASGCAPGGMPFTDWTGASGWANPAAVLAGSTSTASTGNTNPIDLYADFSTPNPVPYDWYRVLEDVGLVVWGSGNSPNAADRVIDACIFLNPTAGCASKVIQITLPFGAAAHVSSGSADPDGAFPAAFPKTPYFGWTSSISPLIRMENMETFGTATVSGSTLSIGSPTPSQHFSSAIQAGQRIFVAGSACPNSLCTASGPPTGAGTLTVNETPGPGTAGFRAYGWGIRVWKDDANGLATIGLNYKLAGSNTPIGTGPVGDKCSSVSVTSGDGKKGYLCSVPAGASGAGWLAFIATDGTTRLISSRWPFSFDSTQGNVFYQAVYNGQGGWTILKNTYTGDYTNALDFGFTCSPAGDCPAYDDSVISADLMPHSMNADLDQQIEANQGQTLPAYNAAIYGPWTQANPAVAYYGSSGHFAFFCNVYSGQGQIGAGGPGWCAVVDLSQSPAKVVRLIHTLDGTGAPNARWGSLHSAQEVDSQPNTLFLSLDDLQTSNTNTLHGGPFAAALSSLQMADGTWSSNTCLDWPPGEGSNCANQNYNRACPEGTTMYAECVTFRLPQGGVCNTAATSIERTNWPCPWNSGYSQYPLMQVGDNAADLAAPGAFDSEHFKVLSLTPDAGNTLRVVAARNSVYDYCSISPWHGQTNPLSAQSAGQLQHANGWSLTMMPGLLDSCGLSVLLQDESTGVVQELGHTFSGHFQTGVGSAGINFVTDFATYYNTPFNVLGSVPPAPFVTTGNPSFAGNQASIGGQLQGYTDNSQFNAGSPGYPWALDMNAFVGCGAELLGCGTSRSLASAGGNVYKIQTIGSAAPSNGTYKAQPMIGWAGRYQLKDVSGPGSNLDGTPYSMCFALLAGECHAGSAANDVYVNVPSAFDPGYCAPGVSWANIPCVMFGNNAPAGGARQFRIDASDPDGRYSRFLTNGWSSVGRHYPYSHARSYPNGQWAMIMGTNLIDGLSMTGFMISLPPWSESSQPDNNFRSLEISLPSGSRYAQVQFGYSRYVGPGTNPANAMFCTSRAEACQTGTRTASILFQSETAAPATCGGGCKINVPVVGPNVVYYRVMRSGDGNNWNPSDVQAVAIH